MSENIIFNKNIIYDSFNKTQFKFTGKKIVLDN